MKVCHLSSAHGQEDTRIFHKECTSLAKAGYTVYQVTKGKTYEKNGVQLVGVENPGKGRLQRMLGTTKQIYRKALELDADVYHAHDPELLPVLLKLKRKGKKTVFDSHEHTAACIEEKGYIPSALRPLVRRIYERYQTRACRRMDAVVTATPNVSDYFRSQGCGRVVDLCNFPILDPEFVEPDYGSKAISFAGGLNRQWNHDVTVQALEEVPGVRYILCGRGSEEYLASLKALPGWSQVDFRGTLPFEQVQGLLRSSAVGMSLLTPGANTDRKNGNMANTKIFEEMMAGLPVICTDFVRWKAFVERYDCGICVDPRDREQIRDAVARLTGDPAEARRMGLNGRRAVETEFNWGLEEKKLISLYRELEEEQRSEEKHG